MSVFEAEPIGALMGFVFLIVLVILTMLPGCIASSRRHHNAMAIWALNLFLGWTVLGWIIALIWSLTLVIPKQSVVPMERIEPVIN